MRTVPSLWNSSGASEPRRGTMSSWLACCAHLQRGDWGCSRSCYLPEVATLTQPTSGHFAGEDCKGAGMADSSCPPFVSNDVELRTTASPHWRWNRRSPGA